VESALRKRPFHRGESIREEIFPPFPSSAMAPSVKTVKGKVFFPLKRRASFPFLFLAAGMARECSLFRHEEGARDVDLCLTIYLIAGVSLSGARARVAIAAFGVKAC